MNMGHNSTQHVRGLALYAHPPRAQGPKSERIGSTTFRIFTSPVCEAPSSFESIISFSLLILSIKIHESVLPCCMCVSPCYQRAEGGARAARRADHRDAWIGRLGDYVD